MWFLAIIGHHGRMFHLTAVVWVASKNNCGNGDGVALMVWMDKGWSLPNNEFNFW